MAEPLTPGDHRLIGVLLRTAVAAGTYPGAKAHLAAFERGDITRGAVRALVLILEGAQPPALLRGEFDRLLGRLRERAEAAV